MIRTNATLRIWTVLKHSHSRPYLFIVEGKTHTSQSRILHLDSCRGFFLIHVVATLPITSFFIKVMSWLNNTSRGRQQCNNSFCLSVVPILSFKLLRFSNIRAGVYYRYKQSINVCACTCLVKCYDACIFIVFYIGLHCLYLGARPHLLW